MADKPKPKYWCNCGTYESITKELDSLVPSSGRSGDKYVDLYRAASNLYYERFNNGNCNSRKLDRRIVKNAARVLGKQAAIMGINADQFSTAFLAFSTQYGGCDQYVAESDLVIDVIANYVGRKVAVLK